MLINGGARDVEALALLPIGIKVPAATPMKTEKRDKGEVDIPLSLAGVDFTPGLGLYADANEVIVVAKQMAG